MCEVESRWVQWQDGVTLKLFCKATDKEIRLHNRWGYYCEDLCGIEQDRMSDQEIENILNKELPKEEIK
jgi:hypothetical protein